MLEKYKKKRIIFISTTTHINTTLLSFLSLFFSLNNSFIVKLKVSFALLSKMSTSFANSIPKLKLLDFFLRLSVIPLSVGTIWLTVTNQQENSSYGELTFINLSGLKYMVCISAICGGYALVAAIALWIRCLVSKAWLFFVSDQIVAYLILTSGAAVLEILYLAYNGDKTVTWSEACSSYGKFCNRMKVALILHGLALFCFLVLSLISAFRAFSVFQPPFSSKQVEGERS